MNIDAFKKQIHELVDQIYLRGVEDTLNAIRAIAEEVPIAKAVELVRAARLGIETPASPPSPPTSTTELRVSTARENDAQIELQILAAIRSLNAEGKSFNQTDVAERAGLKYTPAMLFMGSMRRRGVLKKVGGPRSDIQRWAIVVEDNAPPPRAQPFRRFTDVAAPDPENVIELDADHPAMVERRTVFPSTVVDADASPRLLVSGANSRKLGDRIVKGRWKGMPLYQFTLEERATCSQDCELLGSCYGNGMHLARRHRYSPELVERLVSELGDLSFRHRRGFVVRLHTLGDFPDVGYVRSWAAWLDQYPQLHAFGYTHWPRDSEIGSAIADLTERHWDRFAIRFSGLESGPQAAVTIWRKPEAAVVPEGIVCPAETGRTDCCGTCGLCWAARAKTIVFIAHGPKPSTGRRTSPKPSFSSPRNPLKSSAQSDAAPEQKPRETGQVRPQQPQTRPERPAKPPAPARSVPERRPERHVTPPTRPAQSARGSSFDVKAAVDAYLAKGGKVTVVDNTMTGDPWALKAYLERKGHHVRTGPQIEKPWVIDGKTTQRNDVLTLVNRHRTAEGLAPIPSPKS